MPIDETKFGELIGTVGALVITVADMKSLIIPAIKEARAETAQYREEARVRQEEHDEKDAVVHAVVADLADWARGDGTPDNPGAKKQLNGLLNGKSRLIAFISGIGFMSGIAGHKLSDGAAGIWKWFIG